MAIDGNLTYQQNLRSTALGFVVFQAPKVAAALPNVAPGTVTYITA